MLQREREGHGGVCSAEIAVKDCGTVPPLLLLLLLLINLI